LFTMNIGDLIAPYVGLKPGEKPLLDSVHQSTNGVTIFRMNVRRFQIPSHEGAYTVYFTRENYNTAEPMQSATAIAGFYNAKYFYEMVDYAKINMAVGAFKEGLKIDDEGKEFPLFIAHRYGGEPDVQHSLTVEQLYQVATELSKLHIFCFTDKSPETRRTLNENHTIIKKFHSDKFANDLFITLRAFTNEFARFFKKPAKIPEMIGSLYKDADDLGYVNLLSEQLWQPQVLCHGELTADKLVFDNNGKLLEIRDWDSVHYGSIAEDLSFLIITSSSTDIRRNHFMSVFRHYYYPLVGHVRTSFKLVALKESFRKLHKFAVLSSMPLLMRALVSEISDQQKEERAQRWESAVEDTLDFERADYESDNEDAFFSK
uniref:CHK domain-containing protein n=1 Tax=Anisakis simplex TaxID=6269 RepID=A0A0M3IYT5_ANISI